MGTQLVIEFATGPRRFEQRLQGTSYTLTHCFLEQQVRGLPQRSTGAAKRVGAQHLHCYMAEFDFHYNSRKMADVVRMAILLHGVGEKRRSIAEYGEVK